MTTFATNSDVETRIKGGTDTLEALTESTPYSAAKVDAAREKACGMIRGLIGVKYAIPDDLSAYPRLQAMLREFEIDLVESDLWSVAQTEVPEAVKDKRKQTWEFLRGVAKGAVTLPAPELPDSSQGSSGEVVGEDRVMTRDELGGVY